MRKINIRNYLAFIIVASLLIFSIATIASLYKNFERGRVEERNENLETNLDKAILELELGFTQYSTFVAGLRSYIINSGEKVKGEDLRKFLLQQEPYLELPSNLLINFIDNNHNFIFSVSQDSLIVNDLAGSNVSELRDEEIIAELDQLLKTDELIAFPPLNLYEGFVGLPVDFTVKHNEEVYGYIAVILDVEYLISRLVEEKIYSDFTYRFSTEDGVQFDRAKVYDGSKVYHSNLDTTNLNLDKTSYIYKTTELLGLPVTVGIAYKELNERNYVVSFIRAGLFLISLFLLISMLLLYMYILNLSKSEKLEEFNLRISKANKLLKKFIYAASHDLKQPIQNIDNFKSLIHKKYEEKFDDKGHKYFDIIKQNIDYMNAMLDDLLVYSKLSNRDKKTEDLNINEIVDSLTSSYQDDNISITYGKLNDFHGIKSEITRLFENLISNAIKFNDGPQYNVEIYSEIKGELIEFTVSDNGIGIAEEYRDLIFKEFQRMEKNSYAGTGLGLAICKEIVINHGGKIKATINNQGGTDIIFTIRGKYE